MTRNLTTPAVLLGLMLFGISTRAQAELLSYEGSLTITDDDGATEFAVGDRFDFSFIYDDSSETDVQSSPLQGDFLNSLVDFQLARDPANMGTWDPSGGVFTVPREILTNPGANEQFRFLTTGTGFPTVNGMSFSEITGVFRGTEGTINDTGSGQTIRDQLGGPFDPDLFAGPNGITLVFGLGFTAVRIDGAISDITLVPTAFDFVPTLAANPYEAPANWSFSRIPEVGDRARFMNDGAYAVTFDSSPTNESLSVLDGDVTFRPEFDNRGMEHRYSVTTDAEIDAAGRLTLRGFGNETFVLDSAGPLTVGATGQGNLTVEDGSQVLNTTGTIADQAGSSGHVSVEGADASWTNSLNLRVGVEGAGSMSIEGGATVSNLDALVGDLDDGSGEVLVTGAGSTWNNQTGLFVGGNRLGNGGSGTVTIESGGTVNVDGPTQLHSDGVLRLAGGVLSTETLELLGGNLDWQAGTLSLTGAQGLTVGQGQLFGSSLALNANQNLEVTGTLTIDSQATLFTDGSLSAAAIDNNGDLILASTTVSGEVTSPEGSTITVLGDVEFDDLVSGAGGFFGPGTAIFNGGHSPGDSPAVVTVEGNLAYGGSNTLTIELGGLLSGEFDRLEIQGDATLGGELVVELLMGFDPSFGDEFEILDVDGMQNGEFLGLAEGALFSATGGQLFSITYLGGDGNDIVLTAVPEPGCLLLMPPLFVALAMSRTRTRRLR